MDRFRVVKLGREGARVVACPKTPLQEVVSRCIGAKTTLVACFFLERNYETVSAVRRSLTRSLIYGF